MWTENGGIIALGLGGSVFDDLVVSGIFANAVNMPAVDAATRYGASISSTTYFCDAFWTNNSGNMMPLLVGATSWYEASGMFCIWIAGASSYTADNVGASISQVSIHVAHTIYLIKNNKLTLLDSNGMYGLFPSSVTGSSTTYFCDGAWIDNGGIYQLMHNGTDYHDTAAGIWVFHLCQVPAYTDGWTGASIS